MRAAQAALKVMQLAHLGRPVLQRDDVAAGLPRENRRRRVHLVGIEIVALCVQRDALLGTAGRGFTSCARSSLVDLNASFNTSTCSVSKCPAFSRLRSILKTGDAAGQR